MEHFVVLFLLTVVALAIFPVIVSLIARTLFGRPGVPRDDDRPTGGFPVITDDDRDSSSR